jgi:histidine ammonia-lyase
MGAQYLATSATAENRGLAAPMSVNSISCNASNQDVVSMGTVAARKAFRLIGNAKHVLTLEILADLQALSFRNVDKLGHATGKIHEILSKDFQVYDDSRIFHDDLVTFRKLIFSTPVFEDLSAYFPE